MLTASAWGPPPDRLYRLRKRVKAMGGSRIAVLGCSDGRFVLPFARAQMSVVAIDVDSIALWGGKKFFPVGERWIPGLRERVRIEGLNEYVTIHELDMAALTDDPTHDLVFTSGSLHYSRNRCYPVRHLIRKIVSQARPRGLIYIDYMLPVDPQHWERENYLRRGQMEDILSDFRCEILHASYSGLIFEPAHVDNPKDHYHSLGYVLALAPPTPQLGE
jgi:SAM-dependent methyltransferase